MDVNNLPKVVSRQRAGQESKSQPHKSTFCVCVLFDFVRRNLAENRMPDQNHTSSLDRNQLIREEPSVVNVVYLQVYTGRPIQVT